MTGTKKRCKFRRKMVKPPPPPRKLFEVLIVGKGAKMKIASIGQAIMQAARPRVLLAPLQLYRCTIILDHAS